MREMSENHRIFPPDLRTSKKALPQYPRAAMKPMGNDTQKTHKTSDGPGSATTGVVDLDGGIHLGRFSAEKIRLVAPGADRMGGPLMTSRCSMVPVLVMMACRMTVPCTWAARAMAG
jgi:hypothetical protein